MPNIVHSSWFIVRRFIPKTINHKPSTTNRKSKGFTLIELLVVLSIFAVLAGGLLYSTNNAREKGKDSKRKQELGAINTALIAYYADYHHFPPTDPVTNPQRDFSSASDNPGEPWIPDLANYLNKIPKDPSQSVVSTLLAKAFGGLGKLAGNFSKHPASQANIGQVSGTVTGNFGNNVAGTNDSWNTGNLQGTKFSMGANTGTANTMFVYIGGNVIDSTTAGANSFKLVIYNDNGGNPSKPSTPVANANGVGTVPSVAGWTSVTFPSTVTLNANAKYWLLYGNNANASNKNNTTIVTGGGLNNSVYFGYTIGTALPSNPTVTFQNDHNYSIYVPYSYTIPGPDTTTSAATSITGTTATLNGSANPNGNATTGFFRYSTISPGASCNNTFGTRVPTSGGSSLGSGSSAVAYNQNITGLSASTTYYFCALATNSLGTTFGSVLSFATQSPPTVSTSSANSITSTSATLNGSANPNGGSTNGWFRYGPTNPGTCNDTFAGGTSTTPSSLGSGSSAVSYGKNITSLTPGSTYYYCALASNSSGTAVGTILSLNTQTSNLVEATFGNTAIGDNSDCCNQGTLGGSKFVMGAAPGTVTSMSVYVGNVGGAGSNNYVLAIYTNDEAQAGKLGTKLTNSATGTLTANSWNTIAVSPATLNANTTYWLMYGTNGTNNNLNNPKKYLTGGAANFRYFFYTIGSAFPSNPGNASEDNATYSIYATYTTPFTAPTCTNKTTTLGTPVTVTTSNGSRPYSWNTGGGSPSTAGDVTSLSITYSGAGATGAHQVTVTDANGQIGTCTITVTTAPSNPGGGYTNLTVRDNCNSAKNAYCLRVSDNQKAYVLWAQLENTNDPETSDKADAACKDSDFSSGTYSGLGKPSSNFNYCIKSPL